MEKELKIAIWNFIYYLEDNMYSDQKKSYYKLYMMRFCDEPMDEYCSLDHMRDKIKKFILEAEQGQILKLLQFLFKNIALIYADSRSKLASVDEFTKYTEQQLNDILEGHKFPSRFDSKENIFFELKLP
ncbi:MAG: hypothetical protein ACR2NY_06695 [Alphaproteobacteria bacterium]